MTTPDEVRRTIEIRAPRERVWAALTQPNELLGWFPTERAEIDLRPGGAASFVWEESADEAVVDVVEPPDRLVFRWRPSGLDRPYTTVSFTLEEIERHQAHARRVGVRVAPRPDPEQSQEGNDTGWRDELEELKTYLEAA